MTPPFTVAVALYRGAVQRAAMILVNSESVRVLLSVNRRRFAVSALNASSLTRNRRLRCGRSNPYAFSLIAFACGLVIFFFLALTGCGFGDLRRVESLLLEVSIVVHE